VGLGLFERWGVPSTISPGLGSIGCSVDTINPGIVGILSFHLIAVCHKGRENAQYGQLVPVLDELGQLPILHFE